MNILHVFWGLGYGGIETMLVNMANEQVKRGADVTVVIVNDIIETALRNSLDEKVNFICLGRKNGSHSLGFVIRLNWIILKVKPTAIHIHASSLFAIIAKCFKKRVYTTLHALPQGQTKPKGIIRKLVPILNNTSGNVLFIDKIPHVCSISQSVHDELIENYGVNSIVICNGIKTSIFRTRCCDDISKNHIFKIVQVGRLFHEIKGQDLLIRAIAELSMVDVSLIGIGESLDYLKDLVKELGIDNRVHFLGKKDQLYIAEHLCDYDLFVQPSRWEGFGLTVAEAMSAHIPVLVSKGQGPAEVCRDNLYGWTFNNGDNKDLARMILYIKEHYNEAIEKAKIARIHVINTYDVSITAKKYLNYYCNKLV